MINVATASHSCAANYAAARLHGYAVERPGLVLAWPGLVIAWPGLVMAWPGLVITWPGLAIAWPGAGPGPIWALGPYGPWAHILPKSIVIQNNQVLILPKSIVIKNNQVLMLPKSIVIKNNQSKVGQNRYGGNININITKSTLLLFYVYGMPDMP